MLLSVVVPAHRDQGYLRAAIESVLGQIPGEPELLVVDDGSRDGSAAIAAYRASRGTYFDLLSGRPGDTPGAVATTEDELLELFRTGEWRSARTDGLRAAFRERFCPYDDGHAAERVVRRLFLGATEPDRPATGERPISPVRERPRPVTPGPSRG